jgi:uncharacterized membrane protein
MQGFFEIGSNSHEALNIFPLFIVFVLTMLTFAEHNSFREVFVLFIDLKLCY